MRVTSIESTIGKTALLVPASRFRNARLPLSVGPQFLPRSEGTWVFGVQVRFTLDQPVGTDCRPQRVSAAKTEVTNDLYLERTAWSCLDAAGFRPNRLVKKASLNLAGAAANYQARVKRTDDAPSADNVFVSGNAICLFDGPGRLKPLADTTDPLTGYWIFEVVLRSGTGGAPLGRLKFHFFMEIDQDVFRHGEMLLP